MKTYSMRKKVRFGFVVAAIVLGICLLWFGIDAYVHPNTTYLSVSEKTGYIFTLPDTQNPTCVSVDIKVRKVHYFFHNEEDQLVVILNADIFGDDEEKYFYFLSPDQSDSQFYLSKVDDGTGKQEGEECCLRLSTDNEYVFGWTGFPEYGFSDGQTLLIPAESATQAQEILQKAQEESQEFQNWIKQANDSH